MDRAALTKCENKVTYSERVLVKRKRLSVSGAMLIVLYVGIENRYAFSKRSNVRCSMDIVGVHLQGVVCGRRLYEGFRTTSGFNNGIHCLRRQGHLQ